MNYTLRVILNSINTLVEVSLKMTNGAAVDKWMANGGSLVVRDDGTRNSITVQLLLINWA